MEKDRKRLGEMLVESGYLKAEHLTEALEYQKDHGGLIGQILISLGYVSEENMVSTLAEQLKIPYLPLANYSLNMEAARCLDEEFCKRYVLVVFDADETHIFVAMADPTNDHVLQELAKRTKLKPQIFISTSSETLALLSLVFNSPRAETKDKQK